MVEHAAFNRVVVGSNPTRSIGGKMHESVMVGILGANPVTAAQLLNRVGGRLVGVLGEFVYSADFEDNAWEQLSMVGVLSVITEKCIWSIVTSVPNGH
jgi:hypothetical protein